MRMEPPPSAPPARGTSRAATAAGRTATGEPTVRVRSQGCCRPKASGRYRAAAEFGHIRFPEQDGHRSPGTGV